MNVTVLIDAIVRQTTILIAQLATTAGVRAPLAHIAHQIFLDLVTELESQGVKQKVIADMFGLALRSYQQKVRRLSESATDRGVTLWEAVFQFLQAKEVTLRSEVLMKFRNDNESSVRGILNDLIESGLIYKTGRGHNTMYRVTSDEDLEKITAFERKEVTTSLVWVGVYRHGPVTLENLHEVVPLEEDKLQAALDELIADGRVALHEDEEAEAAPQYMARQCLIPLGDDVGWEAGLFDHYQAVVTAICTKLRNGSTRSLPSDLIGGSTFSFNVGPGHPYQERVHQLLGHMRTDVATLWDEVATYNKDHNMPALQPEKITFYLGQTIQIDGPLELEDED